jgi:adenosine kinase
MGCTGNDKNAEIMKEKAKEVGLKTVYQIDSKTPTGTCAVLISGKDRSLVAHLAAANNFNVSHLDDKENWSYVEKSQIIYISGFFFTVSPETIQRVAKFAFENNKTLALNLSAPFLSEFFTARLLDAMPYVDILFGNDDEAKAFAKNALKLETEDVSEIVMAIANMQKVGEKKRIVIITQGDKPVIYTDGSNTVKQVNVPKIDSDKIIDTNGAGDAFGKLLNLNFYLI